MGQHKKKRMPAESTVPQKETAAAWNVSGKGDRLGLWVVAGILFCLFAAYMFGGSEPKGALVGMAAAIIPLFHRSARARLGRRVTPLTIAVTAFFLLSALASLYSDFGWLSVREFAKLAAAFAVFLLVLALVKDDRIDRMLWMTAGSTAAYALLSIDAAAAKVLFTPFAALLDLLGGEFGLVSTAFEEGTRITGIFGNPNALGGVLAMGIFVALYLCRRAEGAKSKAVACALLAVNALGFFLAFSMGAILFFAVAVLVFLVAATKEERAGYCVLMFQTMVFTILCAFLAYRGLGNDGSPVLAYLAVVLNVTLIWAVDRFAAGKVADFLNVHSKVAIGLAVSLVVLLAAYLVVGFRWAGPYMLNPGEVLERSDYLDAGDYQIVVTGPEDLNMTVTIQTQADAMMHTSTMVYTGRAAGAAFTVPDGAMVAHFKISSPQGGELTELAYAGAENGALKLDYKLLPGFVANRIQGLMANQNAIQRMVFWEDGLKLFAQSPVIGQGTGVYEGRLRSVQEFDYETRYPHNHYVRLMAEMGVAGLAAFLAVAACAVLGLWKLRKTDRVGLCAPLAASVAMLYGHAVVEATWSFGCYLVVAFALLAVIAIAAAPCCAVEKKAVCKAVPLAGFAGVILFFAAIAGFVYADGSYTAIQSGKKNQTPYTMGELARVDVYQGILYKLDMAVNAATSDVPEFYDTAGKYAAQASKRHVYDFDVMLAQHHYFPRGEWESGVAALRSAAFEGGSVSANWQEVFDLLESGFAACPDQDWYAGQVVELKAQMDAFNQGRLQPVELTEENLAFAAHMEEIAG